MNLCSLRCFTKTGARLLLKQTLVILLMLAVTDKQVLVCLFWKYSIGAALKCLIPCDSVQPLNRKRQNSDKWNCWNLNCSANNSYRTKNKGTLSSFFVSKCLELWTSIVELETELQQRNSKLLTRNTLEMQQWRKVDFLDKIGSCSRWSCCNRIWSLFLHLGV